MYMCIHIARTYIHVLATCNYCHHLIFFVNCRFDFQEVCFLSNPFSCVENIFFSFYKLTDSETTSSYSHAFGVVSVSLCVCLVHHKAIVFKLYSLVHHLKGYNLSKGHNSVRFLTKVSVLVLWAWTCGVCVCVVQNFNIVHYFHTIEAISSIVTNLFTIRSYNLIKDHNSVMLFDRNMSLYRLNK